MNKKAYPKNDRLDYLASAFRGEVREFHSKGFQNALTLKVAAFAKVAFSDVEKLVFDYTIEFIHLDDYDEIRRIAGRLENNKTESHTITPVLTHVIEVSATITSNEYALGSRFYFRQSGTIEHWNEITLCDSPDGPNEYEIYSTLID